MGKFERERLKKPTSLHLDILCSSEDGRASANFATSIENPGMIKLAMTPSGSAVPVFGTVRIPVADFEAMGRILVASARLVVEQSRAGVE